MGVRLRWLGTERLTWGDLKVILAEAPRDSAFIRSAHPDEYQWGATELPLLHSMEHTLRILAWQKTEDGSKGRKPPKPIPAPWVKTEAEVRKLGSKPVPLNELDDFLNRMTAPGAGEDEAVETVGGKKSLDLQ